MNSPSLFNVPEIVAPETSDRLTSAVNAFVPPNSETIIEFAAEEKVTISISMITIKPTVPETILPVTVKPNLTEPK